MKRPLQIVELKVPRCALRFGTAPCPATGSLKCFNTWDTCPTSATRAVYDNSGMISWRFVPNRPGLYAFGDFSDPDNVKTNGIPVSGLSVTTSKSQLNIGGMLDGKSPFGIRATCNVDMDDFAWSDVWGDFYKATRGNLPVRMFWAVFLARVKTFAGIEMVIYDGYEGDALTAMRQRLFLLDGIDGPSKGRVTLRGIDPLMLADPTRAQFPPAVVMKLVTDLADDATVLRLSTDDEANLSGIIGLTGQKHLVIGSEIIRYTGYTAVDPGIWDVTGLTRGFAGSTADAAKAGAAVGRAGHFNRELLPDIGLYLLQNWTTIKDEWIDIAGWEAERDTWLSLHHAEDVFVTVPTPVEDLMGELAQQGPMLIWWDEPQHLIRMRAVRPPEGVVATLDTDAAILGDSAQLRRLPESRLTRVFVYYGQIDAASLARDNWINLSGEVYGDGELPQAGGEPRVVEIFARWVATAAHAYAITAYLMMQYMQIPRVLTLAVSAKDRAISIADYVDVQSRAVVDTEGNALTERWQVTSVADIAAGQTYQLTLQAFDITGRFGVMMDTGAPTYGAASDAERAMGCFMADTDGLMSDGSPGYLMQ